METNSTISPDKSHCINEKMLREKNLTQLLKIITQEAANYFGENLSDQQKLEKIAGFKQVCDHWELNYAVTNILGKEMSDFWTTTLDASS